MAAKTCYKGESPVSIARTRREEGLLGSSWVSILKNLPGTGMDNSFRKALIGNEKGEQVTE